METIISTKEKPASLMLVITRLPPTVSVASTTGFRDLHTFDLLSAIAGHGYRHGRRGANGHRCLRPCRHGGLHPVPRLRHGVVLVIGIAQNAEHANSGQREDRHGNHNFNQTDAALFNSGVLPFVHQNSAMVLQPRFFWLERKCCLISECKHNRYSFVPR
jgi:hypothetical protein